jgi:hypothetical protein
MAVKFVVEFHGARKTPLISGARLLSMKRLANYVVALMAGYGNPGASMKVRNAAVLATGSITFTGLPVANDTVTVAGTAFTAKASASTSTEFTIGADATATATNLAAKLNAHTTISRYVTASSALGVVTLTAAVPGVFGNLVTLSEALTNATVSGATLSGGSEDALFSFSF